MANIYAMQLWGQMGHVFYDVTIWVVCKDLEKWFEYTGWLMELGIDMTFENVFSPLSHVISMMLWGQDIVPWVMDCVRVSMATISFARKGCSSITQRATPAWEGCADVPLPEKAQEKPNVAPVLCVWIDWAIQTYDLSMPIQSYFLHAETSRRPYGSVKIPFDLCFYIPLPKISSQVQIQV